MSIHFLGKIISNLRYVITQSRKWPLSGPKLRWKWAHPMLQKSTCFCSLPTTRLLVTHHHPVIGLSIFDTFSVITFFPDVLQKRNYIQMKGNFILHKSYFYSKSLIPLQIFKNANFRKLAGWWWVTSKNRVVVGNEQNEGGGE